MSDIRFNRWLHQSGTGGVYQDSSGNVGIGTSVPTGALSVVGVASATSFYGPLTGDVTGNLTGNVTGTISASGVSTFTSGLNVIGGSVGIGTDNPLGQLTLYQTNNNVYTSTIRNYEFLSIQNKSTTSGSRVGLEMQVDGVGNASVANISAIDAGSGSTDLAIGLRNSNVYQEKLRITSSGNVGINSTVPWGKLDVNGGQVAIRNDNGLIFFANASNGYGTAYGTLNAFVGRVDNAGSHITSADGGYASSTNQMVIGHNGSGGILFGTTDAGPFPSGRMLIDADGRITTPNQISFLQTGMNGADFNSGTLKGGQSDHNVGGHYDTSTGIFTAPIAGYYQFGCGVLVSAATGRLEGYIGKNGGSTIVNFNGTGTTYDGPSATCIFNLAANDNVRVSRVSGTAYATSHGQHYFWGRLLG